MFEIKGTVTTAICFAKVAEDEAINQIKRMCDTEMTRGSQIRIMPDVHAGKGCTMTYKSLEDIIDVIEESVDVIEVLKPIFNYKAS